MRLTLRQLQIFMAVAETGSTAAASDVVHLTQSASSAALRELEGLLNCYLFDRVGKRLLLNDNGRQLIPQARLLLDAATSIEKQFEPERTDDISGLNLGTSTTIGIYLLPTILAEFNTNHQPGKITVANTIDIVNAVADFEVDAGFIEGYCHQPNLHIEPWLQDEMIIVCSPAHLTFTSNSKGKVSLSALRDSHWLLRENGSGTREAVEHALLPYLHYLTPAAEFSNSEAIKNAAVAGMGLACLSRLVVKDLILQGKLIELRSALPKLQRQFYIITAKKKIVSNRLATLLDFCRKWSPNSH